MPISKDQKLFVAVDFGATYSGFAYALSSNKSRISVNNQWSFAKSTSEKVETLLLYSNDPTHPEVIAWGPLAAEKMIPRRSKNPPQPWSLAKLFKMGLTSSTESMELPCGVSPEKAITDYLKALKKAIQEMIERNYRDLTINFYEDVRFVFTVPAQYGEAEKRAMRNYAYNAGFLDKEDSKNLLMTTEPEAAAIHCFHSVTEFSLKVNEVFILLDCGGGTVDITTRQLLQKGRLREVTESAGECCGGSYVDEEFIRYLADLCGKEAIEDLKRSCYGEYRQLIDYFVNEAKKPFTGHESDFMSYEMDLQGLCPSLSKYMTDKQRTVLEEKDWLIEFRFDEIKQMFEPVVKRIVEMIKGQLHQATKKKVKVTALFMVGGFSENTYLQNRVRAEFGQDQVTALGCNSNAVGKPKPETKIKYIAPAANPMTAILRGAVSYGIDHKIIESRVLKYSYGVEVVLKATKEDPAWRVTDRGNVIVFDQFVKRGTQVKVEQEFSDYFYPAEIGQKMISFPVYRTEAFHGHYTNEPGMELLGTIEITLNDCKGGGLNRKIKFSLLFGKVEIQAVARDEKTKKAVDCKFRVDF